MMSLNGKLVRPWNINSIGFPSYIYFERLYNRCYSRYAVSTREIVRSSKFKTDNNQNDQIGMSGSNFNQLFTNFLYLTNFHGTEPLPG